MIFSIQVRRTEHLTASSKISKFYSFYVNTNTKLFSPVDHRFIPWMNYIVYLLQCFELNKMHYSIEWFILRQSLTSDSSFCKNFFCNIKNIFFWNFILAGIYAKFMYSMFFLQCLSKILCTISCIYKIFWTTKLCFNLTRPHKQMLPCKTTNWSLFEVHTKTVAS